MSLRSPACPARQTSRKRPTAAAAPSFCSIAAILPSRPARATAGSTASGLRSPYPTNKPSKGVRGRPSKRELTLIRQRPRGRSLRRVHLNFIHARRIAMSQMVRSWSPSFGSPEPHPRLLCPGRRGRPPRRRLSFSGQPSRSLDPARRLRSRACYRQKPRQILFSDRQLNRSSPCRHDHRLSSRDSKDQPTARQRPNESLTKRSVSWNRWRLLQNYFEYQLN